MYSKYEEIIKDKNLDVEELYIYYNLTKKDNDLSKKIVDDESSMKFLIMNVKEAYLNEKLGNIVGMDLEFICSVAVDYAEELIEDKLDSDFSTICSESYMNMMRSRNFENQLEEDLEY